MGDYKQTANPVSVKVDLDVTSAKAAAQAEHRQAESSKTPVWWWAAGALAVLVILGVALGVGLGVGLKNKHSSSQSYSDMPTYFVAANPITWDYAVSGSNLCYNATYMSQVWNGSKTLPDFVGGKFLKAQYQEYTDDSFTTLKSRPQSQNHLGILGPLIYAEAGSSFRIVFRNNLAFAVNMEPSGGITWPNKGTGFVEAVAPTQTLTWVWTVPADILPTTPPATGYQSSRMFLYRSSVNPQQHDNAGLVGPIIITAKGLANSDGTTKDVDRDIITLFQVYNEQATPYVFANAANPTLKASTFTKMGINGHTWCNIPDLESTVGERVRWHIATVGSEESAHNFHWHGNTLLSNGFRMDHANLIGSNTRSLDVSNDSPGTWLMHCHVNLHMDQGMMSLYTVKGTAAPIAPAAGGKERVYYIQAEEILWNFAPSGGMGCSGTTEPFSEDALVYLGAPDGVKIGSVNLKAVYREYTDATFTTQVKRSANEGYLGFLGPIIRADVGDTIKVVYRNSMRYPSSIHPHGVFYDKNGEGAPYNDGNSNHADDVVMPNTTFTYIWGVPDRAGPGPADPSSMLWMYHSHVSETADTYAGLQGAIIINRKGASSKSTASRAGLPDDIDQDAVLFFTVLDEWASLYTLDSLREFVPAEYWNTTDKITALYADADFHEHERKHNINGFMYCNLPNLTFTAGQRVRIHIMTLGTQEDVHSPSIQGGSFMTLGAHTSTMVTLAGTMHSSDVVFTAAGTFDVRCNVADHVLAGMEGLYHVSPASGPLALPGSVTRTYYIAADQVNWNYAPNGYVQCTPQDLSQYARQYITQQGFYIGPKRTKALYRGYTDATFTTLVTRPTYLGILGPIITAEVGDVITVTFKNNLDFPVSLTPDVGFVPYGYNSTAGLSVQPGTTFKYTWIVPQEAGPLDGDISTAAYPYMSDVDLPAHDAAGLVGLMVIAKKGGLQADGITPQDADIVLPLLFQVYDENLSPYAQENQDAAGFSEIIQMLVDQSPDAFQAANLMHAINGYMYCNLPVITVPVGTRIRLIMLGVGSEEGVHSPRIVGQLMRLQSGVVESATLLPGVAAVGDVTASNPGVWTILSDIQDHIQNGMTAQIQMGSTRRALKA